MASLLTLSWLSCLPAAACTSHLVFPAIDTHGLTQDKAGQYVRVRPSRVTLEVKHQHEFLWDGKQPSYGDRLEGQAPSYSDELEGQVPSNSGELGELEGQALSNSGELGELEGQAPIWLEGQVPIRLEGQAPSYSDDLEGQAPIWIEGQVPSYRDELEGQVPSYSDKLEGQATRNRVKLEGQKPRANIKLGVSEIGWAGMWHEGKSGGGVGPAADPVLAGVVGLNRSSCYSPQVRLLNGTAPKVIYCHFKNDRFTYKNLCRRTGWYAMMRLYRGFLQEKILLELTFFSATGLSLDCRLYGACKD